MNTFLGRRPLTLLCDCIALMLAVFVGIGSVAFSYTTPLGSFLGIWNIALGCALGVLFGTVYVLGRNTLVYRSTAQHPRSSAATFNTAPATIPAFTASSEGEGEVIEERSWPTPKTTVQLVSSSN